MLQKGAIYWAAALGVTAAAGAAGAVWRYGGPLHHNVAPPQLFAPPPVASSNVPPAAPAAPNAPAVVASANPEQPAAIVPPPQPTPAEPSADVNLQRPQFDVVRVEPTGEAVIAGHAAPKAKVAVTDKGQIVAEATADEAGQFVILPPPLAPGGHNLGLTARVEGGKPVDSSELTPIDVPAPPKAGGGPKSASAPAAASPNSSAASTPAAPQPMPKAPGPAPASAPVQPPVAAAPPKAAETLMASRGDAPKSDAPTPMAAPRTPRVVVAGVAVEDAGRLVVTGAASAGALLRLYLNGSFLANVVAGKDGRWSLTVQHGMKGGAYAVRADEIERGKDSVVSRAEVPFNYPERLANLASGDKPPAPAAPPPAAAPRPSAAAPEPPKAAAQTPAVAQPAATAAAEAPIAKSAPAAAPQQAPAGGEADVNAANAIVRDIDTTKVVRGDSLWRISSQHYGNGVRYRQIYAANAAQIRNPRLIYPGQIFVLPQTTPF